MEHDENTMQAFVASNKAGYNGFETDVRMTKDGQLVITHDSNLERTTNGSGAVEEKTANEIRQLSTKKGNKMIFIDELMDFLKDKKGLYVEFEMKTNPTSLYPEEKLPEYCDKLYKAVMKDKPADAMFVFTSSDYRALKYMQTHYPDADLLLITSKPCDDETIALCKTVGINRLGATMNGTSRAAVQKAHKEGLIVSLWPGQSAADFMLGAYLGCDYMCTDIPIELKGWIEKNAPELKVKY
jgi:glycerophosphoryl diester phosphodiesterase